MRLTTQTSNLYGRRVGQKAKNILLSKCFHSCELKEIVVKREVTSVNSVVVNMEVLGYLTVKYN